MEKIILMRELIGLIKEIKKLERWTLRHGRALGSIHARWLMLLNESPKHLNTLDLLSMDMLSTNIETLRAETGRERSDRFIPEHYEKVKTALTIHITGQIKNRID